MTHAYKPVILTIVFGLLCGLLFAPFMYGATYLCAWRFAFRLALCVFLTCYAIGLSEWSRGNRQALVLPLIMVFGLAALESSHAVFLLIYLGLFAVIRSSLLQPDLLRLIGLEGVLCLGGGVFVYSLNPRTNLAWALGIWIFFLIQSLYFVIWKSAVGNVAERQEKTEC